GLAVRARHRSGIEMIAPDDDWRLELAVRNHFVECEAREMSFAESEPANPCGEALEFNPLARHVEPPMQMLIRRKERLHLAIGFVDVVRIAGKRDPAKRPLALAEQRADISRDETRKIESVRDAFVVG